MLRLNKMTDYAIRAIRGIYQNPSDVVTSVQISEQENVPLPVLFKVLRLLTQGGVVRSRRGRGDKVGGYELAVSPGSLTLLDVIRIVQGEPYFSECLKDESICCKSLECKVQKELDRINRVIIKECGAVSLKELMEAPIRTAPAAALEK